MTQTEAERIFKKFNELFFGWRLFTWRVRVTNLEGEGVFGWCDYSDRTIYVDSDECERFEQQPE